MQIEVSNPQDHPLNVTVDHVDGTWTLGLLPAPATRRYELALLQSQPVFVVAADVNNQKELRQPVYMAEGGVARVTLRNSRRWDREASL